MSWRNYRLPSSGGNKYHNRKVSVDGETFDSKKEASRWLELQLLLKAGKITNLERQKKFVLIPAQYEPDVIGPRGGKKRGKLIEHECSYLADFYYYNPTFDCWVVEDTKGMKTKDYIIKRKLMLYMKGIRILEV